MENREVTMLIGKSIKGARALEGKDYEGFVLTFTDGSKLLVLASAGVFEYQYREKNSAAPPGMAAFWGEDDLAP